MAGEIIAVQSLGVGKFRVTVSGVQDKTEHTVTVVKDYYWKLTDGTVPTEELVRKSFEFLLERESKESILSEFNLSLIQKYFPEYETKIRDLLG